MISYTSLHTTYQIVNAIHDGAILLGRRATVGQYRTATGASGYAVIPTSRTNEPETQHAESIDAAARFVAIEGDYNAACALDRALEAAA